MRAPTAAAARSRNQTRIALQLLMAAALVVAFIVGMDLLDKVLA